MNISPTIFNESFLSSPEFKKLPAGEQKKVVEQQFESILFRQMLNDSLKPVFGSYLSQENSTNDIYRYFFTDYLSQSVASQSSLNLGLISSTATNPLNQNTQNKNL